MYYMCAKRKGIKNSKILCSQQDFSSLIHKKHQAKIRVFAVLSLTMYAVSVNSHREYKEKHPDSFSPHQYFTATRKLGGKC